jgi:hypothetical protein
MPPQIVTAALDVRGAHVVLTWPGQTLQVFSSMSYALAAALSIKCKKLRKAPNPQKNPNPKNPPKNHIPRNIPSTMLKYEVVLP